MMSDEWRLATQKKTKELAKPTEGEGSKEVMEVGSMDEEV